MQGYAAIWNYARDQLKQRGVSEKTLGVSDQMIAEGTKASLKFGFDLVAGELIPGYDEAQSAREGDYMGVFMGAIPLLGSVRKIAKALDKASDLTNAGHEVEKLSEAAQGITKEVLNPKDIHFMQSSIKNNTGDFTVLGNAEALANGSLDLLVRVCDPKHAVYKSLTLNKKYNVN